VEPWSLIEFGLLTEVYKSRMYVYVSYCIELSVVHWLYR